MEICTDLLTTVRAMTTLVALAMVVARETTGSLVQRPTTFAPNSPTLTNSRTPITRCPNSRPKEWVRHEQALYRALGAWLLFDMLAPRSSSLAVLHNVLSDSLIRSYVASLRQQ